MSHILSLESDKRNFLEITSRHSLSNLLLNPQAKIYIDENGNGIGYVVEPRGILSIGGLMTKNPAHREACIKAFENHCTPMKKPIIFTHFAEDDKAAFLDTGYKINAIGSSYASTINDDFLRGKIFQQVRRKLNKAKQAGLQTSVVETEQGFEHIRPRLQDINASWIKDKKAKPLRHMVSDFDAIDVTADDTVLMIATLDSHIVSYIVFNRVLGSKNAWFHNLSRRCMSCPDGSMQMIVRDFVNSTQVFQLNFGFTPLVDIADEGQNGSKMFARIANKLQKMGGVVYPSKSQLQYKMSWCPDEITPEYIAYKRNPIAALWQLSKITNAI